MGKRSIDEQISAYLDDQLSSAERAEVDRQLSESPQLRQQLEQMRKLRTLLNELPRHSAPPELADSVLGDLERQMLLSDDLDSTPRGGLPSGWSRNLAVAAVLVLGVGVGFTVYNMFQIGHVAKPATHPAIVARSDGDEVDIDHESSSSHAPANGRIAMQAEMKVPADAGWNPEDPDRPAAEITQIVAPSPRNEEQVTAPALVFDRVVADEDGPHRPAASVTDMDDSRVALLTESDDIATTPEPDEPDIELPAVPLDTRFTNAASGMLDQQSLAEHQFEIEPLVVKLETEDLGSSRKHVETTLLNNQISDVTSMVGGVYVSNAAQVYYRGTANRNFRLTNEEPQEQYLARVPNRILPLVLTQLEHESGRTLKVCDNRLERLYLEQQSETRVHETREAGIVHERPQRKPITTNNGVGVVGERSALQPEPAPAAATSQATTQPIAQLRVPRRQAIPLMPPAAGRSEAVPSAELVTIVIQLRQSVIHSQPAKELLPPPQGQEQ